jgi:hypothetical protein
MENSSVNGSEKINLKKRSVNDPVNDELKNMRQAKC